MNNDQSKIEQLKKKLYSISAETPEMKRMNLRRHASQVATHWGEDEEQEVVPKVPIQPTYNGKKKTSILKSIFILSILAFIATALFAWYTIISGGNSVSAENIQMAVIGPVATPAGEKLALDIEITNRNPERLEAVDIIVEYPQGTRRAEDGATVVLNDRLPVGDIERGQTVRRQIEIILFGEENVKKDIKVIAEYRVPGSVILFRKENVYPIFIGSAPISVDITNFKEIVPGQSATFNAVITSNSKEVIRNLVFKTTYPAGFKFESATPAASFENNTWVLGDLSPGDRREIVITGQILGDANIERYLSFTAGTQDPLNNSEIGVKLVESKEKVIVRRPFLSADISLNGLGNPIYITPAGTPVRGQIIWQNNLSVPVYDAVLELKLDGATLDKKSVNGEGGFYSSLNNTIVWDRQNQAELAEVAPGASGVFEFTLASLPPTTQNNSILRRQNIEASLTIRAKRLSENRVPEEIKSSTTRTIKVQSQIELSSRLVRNVGPFENTGPIPPRADEATTYTVLNSVSNSFNNVKDVTYRATLPPSVTWLGKVYPESAATNVKYNSDTREITWSLGDAAPGLGYTSSPREFAYQVSFTPSISQVGQEPVIINNPRIAGYDTFAEITIENRGLILNTNIQTDPNFRFGWEKVVE